MKINLFSRIPGKWANHPLAGPRTVGIFLFFVSLFFLRYQATLDLNLGLGASFRIGMGRGMLYDLVFTILPAAMALLLFATIRIPRQITWVVLSLFVWLSTLANVLYHRFFRAQLEWWVLQYHWEDTMVVEGSAGSLANSWPVILSVALLAASMIVMFYHFRQSRPKTALSWKARFRLATAAILLIAFSFLLRQSPVWFRKWDMTRWDDSLGSVVNSQAIVNWWAQGTGGKHVWKERGYSEELPRLEDGKPASWKLVEYRKFQKPTTVQSMYKPLKNPSWPLFSELAPSAKRSRDLRKQLGLTTEGPLNVLVFFMESTRQFEIGHPKIGPKIFPRIRSLLANHAIQFTQAYTSSLEAGQTVRGQFSTLCSMLPNITGPAPYIAFPGIRTNCLMTLFKNQGYQTAWLNSYRREFHNKDTFESIHGMDQFFDEDYFKARGITEKIGHWGLADKPMLQESVKVLEEVAAKGPFFAHILTISTHHPPSMTPEPVPADIVAEVGEGSIYHKQLSQYRYEDEAVGAFFDHFFKSPLAKNTLVVLLGDHSTPLDPHDKLTPEQKVEFKFRIPLAIISRDIKKPMHFDYPVHQVDVAPTIATIAGIHGKVSWIGRDLLKGAGSPWVYRAGNWFHYRTRDRVCYSISGEKGVSCLKVGAGQDPLYDILPPVSEDVAQTQFFEEVVDSQRLSIQYNQLQPAEGIAANGH